jgi:ABC-2 type transport system ATP-binding protein
MVTGSRDAAVETVALSHFYGKRPALSQVSLRAVEGELFGVVGPNGSGKSTLFSILATLLRPSEGAAAVLGLDVCRQADQVRRHIGIVFQSSCLDPKLTLGENLCHYGHFQGLYGRALQRRAEAILSRAGLTDRRRDLVGQLSGGLRRRGELARALLHEPRVLLLDEPSAGLDPVARREFWNYVAELRAERQLTVLLTTHLMDEAERCDRLALLHRGEVLSMAAPDALKREMGYDVITLHATDPDLLAARVAERFGVRSHVHDGCVRVELESGHRWVAEFVEAFPGEITSLHLDKPSIEDVFIHRTGASLAAPDVSVSDGLAKR